MLIKVCDCGESDLPVGKKCPTCRTTVHLSACLIDGARGIYVPQAFAQAFAHDEWGFDAETWAILEAGPDHEHYDETWTEVLDGAIYNGPVDELKGAVLFQDGDLFVHKHE